jgi:hypothetical protein
MVGYRNRNASVLQDPAHDDMAARLSDGFEAVSFKVLQTWLPDNTRNLGMREFQSFDLHASIQATSDFCFVSFFNEKLDRFLNHCLCFFKRSSLAGYSKFWTSSDIPLAFLFNHRRQLW